MIHEIGIDKIMGARVMFPGYDDEAVFDLQENVVYGNRPNGITTSQHNEPTTRDQY